MYRQLKYQIKIQPLPSKNLRKNIPAYYIMLISEKQSSKMYSKPLLIDSQSMNEIFTTNEIEFSKVQLWDYDKILMLQEHHVVFSMCQAFTFTCQQQQIVYSIARSQLAKSNKNIGSTPTKLSIVSPSQNNSGRKKSQTEYNEILQKVKNQRNPQKKLTFQNQDDSLSSIRDKKSPPGHRIVSAKQYQAQ